MEIIDKSNVRRLLWLGSAVTGLFLSTLLWAADEQKHEQTSATTIAAGVAASSGIIVKPVQSGTIERHLSVYGRLVLPPSQQVQVRARFPGVVAALHAQTGDQIEKGQALAVVEANNSLQRYTVIAPMAGVVQKQWLSVGELTENGPLFTLINQQVLWAELDIFPSQRDEVQVGQTVHIYHREHRHESVIANITPAMTERPAISRVVARVMLQNQDGDLAPGDKVRAAIDVEVVQAPLRVERRAVQEVDGQSVMFVRAGEQYQAVPVVLGVADATYVQVLSGLALGVDYVVENSYLIKADLGKSIAEHSH